MFIQTEATPNPATLKFIPGKPVLPGTTREYRKAADALESPLAEKLFGVSGVSGVFLGHDFITITKGAGDWQHLKPAILGTIMDHYLSGAPVLAAEAIPEAHGEEFFADEHWPHQSTSYSQRHAVDGLVWHGDELFAVHGFADLCGS